MIELQHVRKVYGQAAPLEDVSVTIHDGDVIAVIGPSGTGKSTLLRCINLLETPTSALDPLTVGEVEEVIAGLAKKGCTMMLVTHSMEFAHSVSNRVFYMDQGGIYEKGTPDQIFNNPQKERTRRFTRRLACLEIEVTEQSHDLVGEIGRFYPFFSGKGLDIQRIINACKSYEEVCSLMFHEILGDERTFDVILEYDARKNRLTMSFAPHSLSKPAPNREHIMSQLEYKLINYYSVDKCVEQSDEGIGIRYTLTF